MNVLSLFDGMSCGQIALNRAGIKYDTYYASEIDKYAIKVTQSNYPNTVQLGDVTKWQDWDIDWSSIGLVTGGFPCQAWSMAGKQLGDKDERGMLFWTMLDIIKKVLSSNPNAKFLMENVKMKKEFEQYITYHTEQALGKVEKHLINSALVSAQNRQRYYWTNIKEVKQPEDRGILFKDVMEKEELSAYRLTDKMLKWINKSEERVKKLKIYTKDSNEKMQMIEASHHKGISNQRCFLIKDPIAGRLVGRRLNDEGKRDDYNTNIQINQTIEFNKDPKKTNTISTVQKDNVILDSDLSFYRYISPLECERLQTVPDGYSNSVSNSQRYKMLGNGWTVDVIVHILKNLNK